MKNLSLEDIVRLRFLLSLDGIGPARVLKLLRNLQSFENILTANKDELTIRGNINPDLSQKIISSKYDFHSFEKAIDKEFTTIKKLNGNILTYWDSEYPFLLKNIFSPPLILYYLGDISLLNNHIIAIVGTRTPSDYGRIQTEKFASDLSNAGIIVASGLARGIDSAAHQSAIKNNGKTIAVIGSGIDVIYPPENKKLFESISEEGLIISEYPIGTKPDAPNFPKRNRIIAGISLGTLVVETRINGGAIQTAGHALNQNREVFAIPGNITSPYSEGTNQLIKRSEAKLVQTAEDILIELNIERLSASRISKPAVELSLFEENILEKLSGNPVHIDLLSEQTSIPTSECLVYLLQLEFKGLVRQLPGKMFIACY